MGLGMLFQKVKPVQLRVSTLRLLWQRLVTPNSE